MTLCVYDLSFKEIKVKRKKRKQKKFSPRCNLGAHCRTYACPQLLENVELGFWLELQV